MLYRRLGNSDLRVSAIAMGCWAIGGRRWGRVDDRESEAAVCAALEVGINFFDTADIYGFGHSEDVLGKTLRDHPDAIVTTKVGLRRDERGRVIHDLSPSHIKAACEASLRRLRRDRIDLYLIHWPDPAVRLEDALAALSGLVEAGKVRYIGASNLSPEDLAAAAAVTGFIAYEDRFSLFQTEARESILPICRRLDIGFIAYEPLFKGMLTGKYPEKPFFGRKDHRRQLKRFGPRFDHYREQVGGFLDVAREFEAEPAALALALLLDEAAVVSAGAKTAAQIRINARAALIDPLILSAAKKRLGERLNNQYAGHDAGFDK